MVLNIFPKTEIPRGIPRVFRIMFPRVIPHEIPQYVTGNFDIMRNEEFVIRYEAVKEKVNDDARTQTNAPGTQMD